MNQRHIFLILICLFFWNTTQAQTKTASLKKINGTQLFIDQEGKGESLIVIHGGPGLNHSYFKPHLDPLTKKFNVIYYDQRACGQSAIPAVDSLSIPFFIDDIESIRKLAGVEKINLLAHSWGALLAVQYGIKYPEHVNKMILSNPVPLNLEYQQESFKNLEASSTPQDSIDKAELMASQEFTVRHTPSSYDRFLKIIFRPSFYDRANISKLNLNIPNNYQEATGMLYRGLGKDLQAYDFYEAVKSFSFPVLVIAGSADNIPMASIQRTQQNISKSKLVAFEKSGHFPFIEETEKFSAEVTSFLKK